MKPALGERSGATHRAVILAMSVAVAVLLAPSRSAGEYFDWRSVNGQDFTTPTRSQFDATCWAFAAVGALEAKYKITRNDPTFDLDFSESHLVYDGRCGGPSGGYTDESLKWFQYNGIVLQQDYPLQPGWQGLTGKIASYQLSLSPNVNDLKSALKKYGPLTMNLYVGSDWYPSESGTAAHAVVIVGFQDDASMP
jgi:C1A family cysteine protease